MKKKLNLEAFDLNLQTLSTHESKFIMGGDGYAVELPEVVVVAEPIHSHDGDDDPYNDYDDYDDYQDYDGDHGGSTDVDTDHDHKLPNLPTNVEQQQNGSSGACVSYAMAFVQSYLGDDVNGAMMALHIAQALGLNLTDVLINGLTLEQEAAAINAFFNHESCDSVDAVVAALDEGNPVLASIDNGDGTSHEVVIVGYDDATNTFTVADSMTADPSGYHSVSAESISFDQGVDAITGVK